jgi:hypothetical protein
MALKDLLGKNTSFSIKIQSGKVLDGAVSTGDIINGRLEYSRSIVTPISKQEKQILKFIGVLAKNNQPIEFELTDGTFIHNAPNNKFHSDIRLTEIVEKPEMSMKKTNNKLIGIDKPMAYYIYGGLLLAILVFIYLKFIKKTI